MALFCHLQMVWFPQKTDGPGSTSASKRPQSVVLGDASGEMGPHADRQARGEGGGGGSNGLLRWHGHALRSNTKLFLTF